MNGWVIALVVCCVLSAAALLIWEHTRRAHQLLAMQRMRNSQMYADLYELIKVCQGYDLDEVRIERDRVTFFGMFPPGCIGVFSLTVGGYRYMNARRVQALTQVLAVDLPQLQSDRHYRLRRYKVMRPNGMLDNAYVYTARSTYKAKVLYARRHVALDQMQIWEV